MNTTPDRIFGTSTVTAAEYLRIVTAQASRRRRIVARTADGPVVLIWDGDAYIVDDAS